MQRTLRIRVKDKNTTSEYKDEMSKGKAYHNAVLYLTRFRFFEYQGKTDKVDYDIRKEYNLEDWFNDNTVFLGNYFSYKNHFLKEVARHVGTTLTVKQQQLIVKQTAQNWKSFFKSLKSPKVTNKVKIPSYQQSDYFTMEYNKQMISKRSFDKSHSIRLTNTKSEIKMPEWLKWENIQASRVKYRNSYIYLEVIYNKTVKTENITPDKDRYASIDLGVNNLATMTFSWTKKPIIIDGKAIKSVNQLYNKERARVSSMIDTVKKEKEKAKLIELRDKITEKRNLRIDHLLHIASNKVIDLLVNNRCSKLIVGKNNSWKNGINTGRKNNQAFVSIPFNKFINYLEYKCQENSIELTLQEESYTSKASFLSNDTIPVYNKDNTTKHKFSGSRRKRGLYYDKTHNQLINADVNGSYNIMSKAGIVLDKIRAFFTQQCQTIDGYGMKLSYN